MVSAAARLPPADAPPAPAPAFPLFESVAFSRRLQAAVVARGISGNAAAEEARVDRATFARAMNNTGALSHEHYLRLELWLGQQDGRAAA